MLAAGQASPTNLKAVATALGCIPGQDSKALLLKMLHMYALTVGHREIKLGVN